MLIEAPGGYGKSVLCGQIARTDERAAIQVVLQGPADVSVLLASLATGYRRAGLLHLSDAIDLEEPEQTADRLLARIRASEGTVVVIDEVQRLADDASSWLASFVARLSTGTRAVLAGRRLGKHLAGLAQRIESVSISLDALRFDATDIGTLMRVVSGSEPRSGDVLAIERRTAGWPAAVALAVRVVDAKATRQPGDGSSSVEPGMAVLQDLVDGMLGATDPDTVRLCGAIAELPLLSAEILAIPGGVGALDRVLDAGLPIRFRADGWGELADPVRDVLMGSGTLSVEERRAVAIAYVRADEVVEGAALLHRVTDRVGLVALLATLDPSSLSRAGLSLIDATLADVAPEELAMAPGLIVTLVRAAEGHPRVRRDWLERAGRCLARDSAEWRAVEVERAFDAARAGSFDEATAIADGVLVSVGSGEVATRGRAHLTRAMGLLIQDPAGSMAVVVEGLDRATALFRIAGETAWEAYALRWLGYGCHFYAGADGLAVERLDRALALQPAADVQRAETLLCVAEVLTHVGRLDDAEVALREASAIGRRLGDARTIGYSAWSRALLCAERRDRAGATDALNEARHHPGGWFDNLPGIDFLCNAAEILGALGEEASAWRYLEQAEQRAAATVRSDRPIGARARLEATYGDPAEGIRLLDVLETNPLTNQGDRWLRLLLRAVCEARLGRADEAAAWLARARDLSAESADPGRVDRREPELMALIMPDAHPTPGRQPGSGVLVRLLGRFAVERDGVDATPHPGRPSLLVKLLAIHRHLTIDEATDALWPDADLDTGNVRLRNVLSRIRAASGPIVVREEGVLRLGPDVEVDADRFESEAIAALGAPALERAGSARRALARSTGTLLPGDRFADWTVPTRERLRSRHLELVDIVVDDAIERGELDEASRLLDQATAEDALEEARYVRLAMLLHAQGRSRRARRVIRKAIAMCEEVDVEPSPELLALLADVEASAQA